MHKRILLAEESDTIRGIAESLLRQNGYEVLSMTSGEKSIEVLNFTKPDLIVLASDMTFKGHMSLLDKLQSDAKTSGLPLLIMKNENAPDIACPPEVIVNKPFNPKEFIEKVNALSGSASQTAPQSPESANPLGDSSVEDEFLDAALGLDQLDVTDSEIMNQTSTSININKKTVDKMIGYDHKEDVTNIQTDSGKVESLMIRDEEAEISQNTPQKPPADKVLGTGKLEILDDQFGMVEQSPPGELQSDSDHDYNWFLNELKNDAIPKDANKPDPSKLSKSQEISFEDNASIVEPVPSTPKAQSNEPPIGVDKFIDEFKKEIEKFSSQETESITLNESDGQPTQSKQPSMEWRDSIESISPEQMGIFKTEFVKELAERLAVKIAEKIDAEKLLSLLKQELINRIKK